MIVTYIEFPKDKEMDSPPPDGLYATISHNRHTHTARGIPVVFAWSTVIYRLTNSVAEEIANGSNPAHMLGKYPVDKVFLIGLDARERAELDAMLGKREIELKAEPIAA